MKPFWSRLEDAWKTLRNKNEDEEKLVQVITEDSRALSLINERMSQFEQDVLLKRMDRLEKTLNYLLVRMNQIAEMQEATKEVMIAFSTASEEISHGFEVLADSLINQNPPPVQTTKKVVSKSSIDAITQYPELNGRKQKPDPN